METMEIMNNKSALRLAHFGAIVFVLAGLLGSVALTDPSFWQEQAWFWRR